MGRIITILFLCLLSLFISAQDDYEWWNQIHDWDGYTHWTDYYILSSAFMGPNALPVNKNRQGLLKEYSHLEFSVQEHYSRGDNTQNLFAELFVSLMPGKYGVGISMVPLERYDMDTATRDERFARDYDGEGYAIGDVYIYTYIQLLRDHERYPNLLLTITLKTASGSGVDAARYTDTPGYAFDLSYGKEFKRNGKVIQSFYPYMMMGFYSYQTNIPNNFQDDAFLYSIGFKTKMKKITIDNELSGYFGYLGNGDRPLLYRLYIKGTTNNKLNYGFSYQLGLNDFDYNTFSLSLFANLNHIFNGSEVE